MILRSILSQLAILISSALLHANEFQPARPTTPPSDQAIHQSLPRSPGIKLGDHFAIIKEELNPGLWKCSVHYSASVRLPWGTWIYFDHLVSHVYMR